MEELAVALTLGLAAGVSPGPLLTLVVSATLERGFGAGLRVASAPLVTDLPIILACLLVLRSVPEAFLAGVTLLGGAFVTYLGVDTLRRSFQPQKLGAGAGTAARDLWRGVVVNLLSPHPWLFWLGVGTPLALRLWAASPALSLGWIALFYSGLVGSKIALAWIVARGRGRLDQRWYHGLLAGCGAMLVALGGLLLFQGGRAVFDVLSGS